MWLAIGLIIVCCVVVWLVTAELIAWLVKRSVRKAIRRELGDLVKKAEEEERKESK